MEVYESLTDMFENGYFRANMVIVGDRPEVAALAATSSYVKVVAESAGILEHAPKTVDVEVVPSLKVILSSSTPVRHNTFDTACRIGEAISGLSEKSFIIEISGPGVEGLPLEDRMSLLGYLSLISGRNAVIEPDQTFLNYLNHYGGAESPVPYSDKNAPLLDSIPITLARLRSPIYALRARRFVSGSQEMSAKQLRRLRVGPLLGGSVDDFRQLAQSLRGEKIKKNLQLYLIPSSQAIFAEALRRRYVHAIVESGGRVGNISSAPHLPVLQPNEFELTTELSPTDSDSYLASIQTMIQSLRTGKISRRSLE
jgi:3-isopropylmalate/(R)-2-methylmalate dehydratase large subunit